MSECQNCGAYVNPDYHRVFSDNDGNLRACTSCGRQSGNNYTVPGGDPRGDSARLCADDAHRRKL